jgi:hypothetical protein
MECLHWRRKFDRVFGKKTPPKERRSKGKIFEVIFLTEFLTDLFKSFSLETNIDDLCLKKLKPMTSGKSKIMEFPLYDLNDKFANNCLNPHPRWYLKLLYDALNGNCEKFNEISLKLLDRCLASHWVSKE